MSTITQLSRIATSSSPYCANIGSAPAGFVVCVGAGIREDLECLEGSAICKLIERLRESSVPEETLIQAASDVAKFDG